MMRPYQALPLPMDPPRKKTRLTRSIILARLNAGEALSWDEHQTKARFPNGDEVSARAIRTMIALRLIDSALQPIAQAAPAHRASYRVQIRHFIEHRIRAWGYGKVACYTPWRTEAIRPTLEEAIKDGEALGSKGLTQVRILLGNKTEWTKNL